MGPDPSGSVGRSDEVIRDQPATRSHRCRAHSAVPSILTLLNITLIITIYSTSSHLCWLLTNIRASSPKHGHDQIAANRRALKSYYSYSGKRKWDTMTDESTGIYYQELFRSIARCLQSNIRGRHLGTTSITSSLRVR